MSKEMAVAQHVYCVVDELLEDLVEVSSMEVAEILEFHNCLGDDAPEEWDALVEEVASLVTDELHLIADAWRARAK